MLDFSDQLAVSPVFRMSVTASEQDIDELGHVSNVAYVHWLQEVAKAHSAAVGYDHQAYLKLGMVFVVRKYEIIYLLPAFLQEPIILQTHVAWWKAATSERRTRIIRESDGAELVRAATLWAFISTENGKPRRIPTEVADAFKQDPTK